MRSHPCDCGRPVCAECLCDGLACDLTLTTEGRAYFVDCSTGEAFGVCTADGGVF